MGEQFFTYRLFKDGELMVIGKGKVKLPTILSEARSAAIKRRVRMYLKDAYGRGWQRGAFTTHATESAAFKKERLATDEHKRRTGALPPWNRIRGGSGGRTYQQCKAMLSSGERCMNLARQGNYGYCDVHRR